MYEVARWLAVEVRSCCGSLPRTTMKNESGTYEIPCSSGVATPYWGKGQRVKKKKKIYIYIYK